MHLALRNRVFFNRRGGKQQWNSDDIKRGKEKVTEQLISGFCCFYKIRCQKTRVRQVCVKSLHKCQNTFMKTMHWNNCFSQEWCSVDVMWKEKTLVSFRALLLVHMTSHEFVISKQTNKVDIWFNSTVSRWILDVDWNWLHLLVICTTSCKYFTSWCTYNCIFWPPEGSAIPNNCFWCSPIGVLFCVLPQGGENSRSPRFKFKPLIL